MRASGWVIGCWAAVFGFGGCDGAQAPEVDVAPLAASRWAERRSQPALEHRREEDDPFVQAIARATSVLSEGGIAVHDYEWDDLRAALRDSRLPSERLRLVSDRLFIASVALGSLGALSLPPAMAPPPMELGHDDWGRVFPDEPIALYALPPEVSWGLFDVLPRPDGAVMVVRARVLRRAGDHAAVGARVTIATSDCGWCMDNIVYDLAADGSLVGTGSDPRLHAGGYCC